MARLEIEAINRFMERLQNENRDEIFMAIVNVCWDDVHIVIAGFRLNEEDSAVLKLDLHRVFGAAPNSALKALQWLADASAPCGGRPRDVLSGIVADMPKEIGVPRVLSYLRHAADAPA